MAAALLVPFGMRTILAAPGDPVIDLVLVAGIRAVAGDAREDVYAQLVRDFLGDARDRLSRLHSAVAARDASAISLEAGALKQRALSVGAVRLAQTCEAFEQAAGLRALARADVQCLCVEVELHAAGAALEPFARAARVSG